MKLHFIPHTRHSVWQVHIVTQQWLARGGVRSGNNPVVGTRKTSLTVGQPSLHIELTHAFGWRRFFFLFWLLRNRENCSSIIGSTGRWPITPGDYRIQISHQLRRELCADLFPPVLCFVLGIQQL